MVASAHSTISLRLEVAGKSDTGRRRTENEDSLLLGRDLDLFVVADGMGGTNAGEIASRLAVQAMARAFRSPDDGRHNWPVDQALDPEARRLVAAVRWANEEVFDASMRVARHRGMGSTVVAAHLCRPSHRMHIAHVGDSRCYRLREGSIEQLTRDHSLLSDARTFLPHLGDVELARIPRNVISRALGLRRAVKVDIRTEPVRVGDTFLLCTDGLSSLMTDAQILETWELTDSPTEACDLLVALANEQGGTDNVTIAMLRVEGDGQWPYSGEGLTPLEPSGDEAVASRITTARASSRSQPPLEPEPRSSCAEGAHPRNFCWSECPACGAPRSHTDAYCGQCGTKL